MEFKRVRKRVLLAFTATLISVILIYISVTILQLIAREGELREKNAADQAHRIASQTRCYLEFDDRPDGDLKALIRQLNSQSYRDRIKTGEYFFVFNEEHQLLVHPDLHDSELFPANPVVPDPEAYEVFRSKGRTLIKNLAEAYTRGEHWIAYNWEKSGNKGKYHFTKRAYLIHIDDPGWYIGMSSYNDEFSRKIINIIIGMILFGISLILIAVGLFHVALLAIGKVQSNETSYKNKLKSSELRYRSLYENSMDGYVRVDLKGQVVESNRAYRKMLGGYSVKELSRMKYTDYTPTRWIEHEETQIYNEVMKQEHSSKYEKEYIRKDGTVFPVELVVSLVRNEAGEPAGFWAYTRELTEQKRQEQEILKLRNKLENVVDSMPSALIGIDPSLSITQWNRAAEIRCGVPQEKAKGQLLINLLPAIAGSVPRLKESISEQKVVTGTLTSKHPVGGERIEEMTIFPLRGRDREGAVILLNDVTRQAEMEKLLNYNNKMEAVGRLAGGVAHDFNNLLAGIIGTTELLQEGDGLSAAEQSEYHELILQTAQRAADLTEKLLTFSRKGKILSTELEVHPLIGRIVEQLETALHSKIRLKQNRTAERDLIAGVASELEKGLGNVIRNAADAMPDGGEILIKTENIELDEMACHSSSYLIHPGSYLKISVQDSGSGIDAEVLPHIFEPFFTTHDTGEGVGLGLSTLHGIILDHHGAVEVSSRRGFGTTVIILLPLT